MHFQHKNSLSNIRHINLIPLSTEFSFSVNLDSNLYPFYSNFAKSIFIMSLKLIRFSHFWYKIIKKVAKTEPITNSSSISYP